MIKNKIKKTMFTTMFTLFILQQANGMLSNQVHQIIDDHTITSSQSFDANIQTASNAIRCLYEFVIQAQKNPKINLHKVNFWNLFFQSILTKLERITYQEKTPYSPSHLEELNNEIQKTLTLNINTGILSERFERFKRASGITINPNIYSTQNINLSTTEELIQILSQRLERNFRANSKEKQKKFEELRDEAAILEALVQLQ